MCDPITLTGLALTAASVTTNQIAQGQVQDARDSVLNSDAQAQQGYFGNEQKALDAARGGYGGIQQTAAAKGKTLGDAFATAGGAPQSSFTGPDTSLAGANNPMLANDRAQQNQAATDYSNTTGQALGKLRGTTQALADANLGAADQFNTINTNQGFAGQRSAIVPYQLQDANNAAGFLPTLGSIFQIAGTAAMGAGALAGAAGAAGGDAAAAGAGSGASGTGVGTFWQSLLGDGAGSAGRWLAGNAGQQVYNSAASVGPYVAG